MKIAILVIGICFTLAIILVSAYDFYRIYRSVELGKSFPIVIEAGEVIDYNAVNQEQYSDGSKVPLLWFTMLRDTEREKLSDYMKENNYRIVPGTYQLRQGYKFKDLLKELKFEEIT